MCKGIGGARRPEKLIADIKGEHIAAAKPALSAFAVLAVDAHTLFAQIPIHQRLR